MLRWLSYEDYQSATETTELKKAIEADAIEVLEKALEVGKVDQEELLHDVAVSEAAYEVLDCSTTQMFEKLILKSVRTLFHTSVIQ